MYLFVHLYSHKKLISTNQALYFQGVTLNDLLNKSKFLYDQREVVLKAVRRLDPDFTPVYTAPELDYVCPLLENLKLDQIEDRIGLFESPAEGLLTVEELKQRVKKQLEIEIKGEIEVKNIDVKDETSETVNLYVSIFSSCCIILIYLS